MNKFSAIILRRHLEFIIRRYNSKTPSCANYSAIMTSTQCINYSAILHTNYFRRYRGPLVMTSSCLLPVYILITSGAIRADKWQIYLLCSIQITLHMDFYCILKNILNRKGKILRILTEPTRACPPCTSTSAYKLINCNIRMYRL